MISTLQVRHAARPLASMLLALSCFASSARASSVPLSGLWDATIHVGAIEVPFEFGIAVKGDAASGWFFNGEQKVTSSSGTYHDGHLLLEFDSYAKKLQAELGNDGSLDGIYVTTTVGSTAAPVAFHARHATAASVAAGANVPSIAGLWLVPAQSSKANEGAWRLIVRQTGPKVSAAILRVDGDTGSLTGRWQDGKLLLSHFDGARPALIEVTPAESGTLKLILHNSNGTDQTLTGYRQADATAKGLPAAADPANHTTVKDPSQPLQFSFPDLNGHIVSNTDSQFQGKVLLIDISGSWCPNCHDEAPFLQQIYRKYHSRGLEIVTLNFEDSPEQFANPVRLRAFVKDFGLEYIVLQAGTTQRLHEMLPQAVNLDAYPTTFFVGRDGLVRGAHAGFAAPATGDFHSELKKAFTTKVEGLLAEKKSSAKSAALAAVAVPVMAAAVPARDLPAAHP